MLRRSRSDTLSVLRRGTKTVLDAGEWVDWGHSVELPTQRRFQVSSEGRFLALTGVQDRACRVYDRGVEVARLEGVGGSDYRFLPGQKSLAAVVGDDVFRLDLHPYAVRRWGTVEGPLWIEASALGLVVLHHAEGGGHALSLLPWSGPQRLLAKVPVVSQFVTAKAGSRLVYATPDELFDLELRAAEAPRSLGPLSGPVTNGEMAPDGGRFAFTSGQGLFLGEGSEPVRRRSDNGLLHTIWFAPDGRSFAWAGNDEAHWEHDGETRSLPSSGGMLQTLRFLQAGVGLIVARGQEVLLWTPHADRVDLLATVPGDALAGADLCRFGLVVWEVAAGEVQF